MFKVPRDRTAVWISIDRLKPAIVLRDDPMTDHSYAAHAEQIEKKRVRFSFPGGE
jgi:hypothetical protein